MELDLQYIDDMSLSLDFQSSCKRSRQFSGARVPADTRAGHSIRPPTVIVSYLTIFEVEKKLRATRKHSRMGRKGTTWALPWEFIWLFA